MEIMLFSVIVLQMGYIVYITTLHSKEREKIRVYNKSESAGEYMALTQQPEKVEEEVLPDNIIPFEETTIEDFEKTV